MGIFWEKINSDTPVLVDFFAEWCGPCKAMAPALKEVALELGDKAIVLKVDVDKNPEVARKFQIRGVPTLVLFKKGSQLWRRSGALPKNLILEEINAFIS